MIYNTDNQEKRTSKPIKLYDGFCNEYIVTSSFSGGLVITSRDGKIEVTKDKDNRIKISTKN